MDNNNFRVSTDLDVTLLLDIDVSKLYNSSNPQKPLGVVTPVLKLEDLENIDWDSVTTSVLGILDPIGQLRDWLSGILAGFIDSIKSAVEGIFSRIISPISDTINSIWSTLSSIPGTLSNILNTLSNVVIKPIQDALNWVATNFPEITKGVTSLISQVTTFITNLPSKIKEFIDKVGAFVSDLTSKIQSGFSWFLDQVGKLPGMINDLIAKVSGTFSDLASKIQSGFSWFVDQVGKLPSVISDLISKVGATFSDLTSRIQSGFAWFVDQVAKLPGVINDLVSRVGAVFSDLASKIQSGLAWVGEQLSRIPATISDIFGRIGALFTDLAGRIQAGFSWFLSQVANLPTVISDLIGKVGATFNDLANRVRSGFEWFINQVIKLPDTIRELISKVVSGFTELTDKIKGGFSWFIDQVTKLPGIISDVMKSFSNLIDSISKGLSSLIDSISKAPETIKGTIDKILGDVTSGVGGVVGWIRKGFESLTASIDKWFSGARDWFTEATKALQVLGANFMGFVNAVMQLPERLGTTFGSVIDFFKNLWSVIQSFLSDPLGWLRKNIVDPFITALLGLGSKVYEGLKTLWDLVLEGLKWLWSKLVDIIKWVGGLVTDVGKALVEGVIKVGEGLVSWGTKLFSGWFKSGSPLIYTVSYDTAKDVEAIFQEALKRVGGVAENLWLLSGELLYPYWRLTLLPLVVRGLVRTFGDFNITLEPSIVGSKLGHATLNIRFSELADAFVRGFETFYSGYAIGATMAIANMFIVNLQQLYTPRVIKYYDERIKDLLGDIVKEEVEAGAKINMFLKPVSETALIDYARRMLALSEGIKDEKKLKELLATVRAHLKIYGLPAWYIDYLTTHPEKLAVSFMDRFGADRKVYLSHIFELPTHSELARMTQRDIFPGVDVMKRVAWVRGWNEDLTTMIYLLTFKYPSFEKLWTFYMRALAGMLWFKAPEHIKAVFDREAEEVKAGKPISPLDLQRALVGPDQVKAFETALNTYFKWLEYSNFSWFTDKTSMYGINIGAEVVGKLGGWTADSWLLVDVAADIPGKIDMRWMSRFGLFLHMAKKFEEVGVRFETYTPLVEAVPKLMEGSPATPIQVDLRWFSKLLQATGLHPAWVPVVTVAENVMAIADEMTLLRTGWLNLFKEGMITVEDAEKYLAGLITTSYLVGYWDPDRKVWTSGWINLPVRWLPHERKLLQLRMAIDRVMDVFREVYSYIRSGIRTLALTPEDAKERLTELVDKLNTHYKELTKEITGQEFELRLDAKYISLWLEVQRLAQDIEARERVRTWWSRVSGWILYRVAYGYVTDDEISNLIDTVSKYIPLHELEVNAYKEIAKALLGIARKEAIPSPSTLATFAEYMVLDVNLIKDTLSKYNVPKEYHELWIKYISVKPIKSDYKAVLNVALKALRYGVISKDYWESLLKNAEAYGFTPTEISLISLRSELELMIDEAKLWRPTLLTLISIAEYVPEATKLLEYYRVDPIFRPIIERYALVKPLADEIRTLVNALYRAKRYVTIPKELEDKVLSIVKQFGVTDMELMIRDMALELTVLVDEAKEYVPPLSTLVTMAEYLPEVRKYLKDVLEVRKVRGVWAELWTKYIYLRPVYDDVRRWANAMFTLAEYLIIDMKQLEPVFKILSTYGWEELEVTINQRLILAEQVRIAFNNILGAPRTLAGMARYTDKAADWAYSRAVKLISALPVDDKTKELLTLMWKEYITSYQAYPEIRSYMTELINAYAYGVLDDKGLEQELDYLRKLGVPELRLALVKRTAMLRRARVMARMS